MAEALLMYYIGFNRAEPKKRIKQWPFIRPFCRRNIWEKAPFPTISGPLKGLHSVAFLLAHIDSLRTPHRDKGQTTI
jgi:hypothetical protein